MAKVDIVSVGKGVGRLGGELGGQAGTLSDCVGGRVSGGVLRPVQRPETVAEGMTARLLLTHTSGGVKRYIGADADGLLWWTEDGSPHRIQTGDGFDAGSVTDTAVTGNTVILLSGGRPWYFLLKNGEYKPLGDRIPMPSVRFALHSVHPDSGESSIRWSSVLQGEYDTQTRTVPLSLAVTSSDKTVLDWGGKPFPQWLSGDGNVVPYDWNEGLEPEAWCDLVLGLYASNLEKVRKKKGFANPFFLRYALRLFDGSYAYVSQPILMIPSKEENTVYCDSTGEFFAAALDSGCAPICYTCYSMLYYKDESDYEGWRDIVEGIDVFVTRSADLHEADSLWAERVWNKSDSRGAAAMDSYKMYDGQVSARTDIYVRDEHAETSGWDRFEAPYFHLLKRKSWDKVMKELVDGSVFRKIAELPVQALNSWQPVAPLMDDHVLETLDTQTMLSDEDYHGWSNLWAEGLYTYNGRLHLWGLKRDFWDGFTVMSNVDYYQVTGGWPTGEAAARLQQLYTQIETEDGTKTVKAVTWSREALGECWLYYPDPRAKKLLVYGPDGQLYLERTLKEHPTLNGAYWAGEPAKQPYHAVTQREAPEVDSSPETLYSQIAQSEAGNPWVIGAGGYHKVGHGDVIGMSTSTHALSDGEEHGTHPLLVFTTDGIWALAVNADGSYKSASVLSREVCSDRRSIVEVDDSVFFASAKGLMRIAGNRVTNASAALDGRVPSGWGIPDGGFPVWLRGARIAYDYRDRLLWIFREDEEWSWLYDMEGGTWSRAELGGWKDAVRDYPDTLLVGGGGEDGWTVESLLRRCDPSQDTGSYDMRVVTRAMNLGSVLNLKSVRWVRHLADTGGRLRMEAWGSDDLRYWCRLGTLRGKAWRWYRLVSEVKGMQALDSYAGMAVSSEERRRTGDTFESADE